MVFIWKKSNQSIYGICINKKQKKSKPKPNSRFCNMGFHTSVGILRNKPGMQCIRWERERERELRWKMNAKYLRVRRRFGFEAPQAIILKNKVPFAWVLQPKPIGPNDIKPTLHCTIILWDTHLRKDHSTPTFWFPKHYFGESLAYQRWLF